MLKNVLALYNMVARSTPLFLISVMCLLMQKSQQKVKLEEQPLSRMAEGSAYA